jgi:uncharacterized protein (TIGR03032 family)
MPTRTLAPWLADQGASIAFTTYQANKLFFVGVHPETGAISIFERSFERCMGLGYKDGSFWLASLYQLWRFENLLAEGEHKDGYDAVFVPLEGRTTGDVDIHDVHLGVPDADPLFVVTRANCLATLGPQHSFVPVWKPPFIDRIALEDRCHLNGLAIRDDTPAFVTCVSQSNIAGGWRDNRQDGGVVLDIASGEVVASGLSMPHSPRWHDGQLYILQSGTGEFGQVDLDTGQFDPICFLPGFPRGVGFIGNHAVIGVSKPRDKTFEGLPLEDRLRDEGMAPRCQIAVVNLTSGDIEHALMIDGAIGELYDVVTLPNVARPMALGFKTNEIRFHIKPGPLQNR